MLASILVVASAAHSTAGISRGVDKKCERLLFNCEGIARAAIAWLEFLGRRSRVPPPLALHSSGGDVDTKAEEDRMVVGKKERRRPKKKRANPSCGDAAAVVMGSELVDEWAYAVSPKLQSQTQPVPPPLPPSVSRALARGDSDETHKPKLKQSRGASSAASSAPPGSITTPEEVGIPSHWQRSLMVGNVIMFFGLTSRRELNGQLVRLLFFDDGAKLWSAQLLAGWEPVKVRPDFLKEADRERLG